MKVAIIHYWLVTMRGGERVLERICRLYPQADIFTHVYDPTAMSPLLRSKNVKTTFIQKLPYATKLYQKYLPLMPMALEEIDLSDYDLVISAEAGPAKGVIARPDATHVCYCHSPMRYIWDQYHTYKASAGLLTRLSMPLIAHGLRQWDVTSAARVDTFAANSQFVAQRIRKYYRREATVVHPPVSVDLFSPAADLDSYFLWVGQLVPYKGCDIAIEAFNRLKLPLLIVGDGAQKARLKKIAGSTIRFAENMSLDQLRNAYARAQALVFTAKEDFGIVPIEAQASGRPVIAYGAGGALETVRDNETGLFFPEQTADSLVEAVERFISWKPHYNPAKALANAQDFRPELFDERFRTLVQSSMVQNGQRPDGVSTSSS